MMINLFRAFRFLPGAWWRPQAWRTWSTYLHWRMETYGVYFPDGQRSSTALRGMLKQLPSYLRWLKELDQLHRDRH